MRDINAEIADFVHLLATKQIRVTHIEVQESPTTLPYTAMRAPALFPPKPPEVADPLGRNAEFENILNPELVAEIKKLNCGYQTFKFAEGRLGWVSYKEGNWKICVSSGIGEVD